MRNFFIFSLFVVLLVSCEKPSVIGGRTMGTTYHITVFESENTSQNVQELQNSIDSILVEVNNSMSTYISNSEISRFNDLQSADSFLVSAQFMQVLKAALQIYKESEGAFDVTIGPLVNLWGFGTKGQRFDPPRINEIERVLKNVGSNFIEILNDSTIRKTNPAIVLDFSAIAKGYGVDAAAEYLKNAGYKNYLVEIGGEIVVSGKKQDDFWRIGVDSPVAGSQPGSNLQQILNLSDIAMATSGDYRNYFISGDSLFSHEIDPKTGKSIVTGVASVTVLAPSCMIADAIATAIMITGPKKGLAWIENIPQTEAFIIMHDGNNFKEMYSSGFKKYLE